MGMGIVEAIFQLESRDFHNDSNYSEALCVVQDYIREIVAREYKGAVVIEKARVLAHNAHKQTQGDMLPDERELYDAVLRFERS
jgi:hypothetical protein